MSVKLLNMQPNHPLIVGGFGYAKFTADAGVIIKNRIEKTEQLQEFDWEGYKFAPQISSDNELVFVFLLVENSNSFFLNRALNINATSHYLYMQS